MRKAGAAVPRSGDCGIQVRLRGFANFEPADQTTPLISRVNRFLWMVAGWGVEKRPRDVRCLPSVDQRFCRPAARPVRGLAFGPGQILKGSSRALCTRSARAGFDLRVHRALEKRPRLDSNQRPSA